MEFIKLQKCELEAQVFIAMAVFECWKDKDRS